MERYAMNRTLVKSLDDGTLLFSDAQGWTRCSVDFAETATLADCDPNESLCIVRRVLDARTEPPQKELGL
jgi:hypothetical protein